MPDRSRACLLVAALAALVALDAAPARAASELTVATINLRSHYDRARERLPAIEAFLEQERPDLVLLQEVGAYPTGGTQAHALAEALGYRVAHAHNPRTRRGLAVLSRFPIRDVATLTLPVKRRLALGVVVEAGGRLISVVNLHLTPQLDAGPIRARELQAARRLAHDLPGPTLVGGDFNFGDQAPENAVIAALVDTFRAVRPRAAGFTWHHANPLARKNSYPTEGNRRLDRILVDHPEVEVLESRIVLNEPVRSGLYPSDHFGLLSRLRLAPTPQK